jgi:hypothetical protein
VISESEAEDALELMYRLLASLVAVKAGEASPVAATST